MEFEIRQRRPAEEERKQQQEISKEMLMNNKIQQSPPPPITWARPRYGVCMKNHAVNDAMDKGVVLDGCCEFMAAAGVVKGSPEALNCVACGCHRSFHRREDLNDQAPRTRSVAAAAADGGPLRPSELKIKKRFRTRITPRQKASMYVTAEIIGWRLRRAHEEMVKKFCKEINLPRRVFQVWMYNHKPKMRRITTALSKQPHEPQPQN